MHQIEIQKIRTPKGSKLQCYTCTHRRNCTKFYDYTHRTGIIKNECLRYLHQKDYTEYLHRAYPEPEIKVETKNKTYTIEELEDSTRVKKTYHTQPNPNQEKE